MGAKGLVILSFSRIFFFTFFQLAIALVFGSWSESIKYWMLTATATNIVSIAALIILFKREEIPYLSIFHFRKENWKMDLMLFSGVACISIFLVIATPYLLQSLLWGDATYSQAILFQPIPEYLVYFLIIAFPVTISLSELATYFRYIMPRLKLQLRSKWLVIGLSVLCLSIQHCALPLIFDIRFILFRGLSYLPFALLLGISLYKRPALLPHFAILHGLLDASAATMYLVEP